MHGNVRLEVSVAVIRGAPHQALLKHFEIFMSFDLGLLGRTLQLTGMPLVTDMAVLPGGLLPEGLIR